MCGDTFGHIVTRHESKEANSANLTHVDRIIHVYHSNSLDDGHLTACNLKKYMQEETKKKYSN